MNDPANRRELVTALRTYCQEILSTAPTNTPDEDRWINTEGDTTDMARIGRLLRSPEYSRRSIKQTFSECVETAAKIEAIQIEPVTDGTFKAEAANLVSLALTFNNDADLQLHARQAGLDGERLALDLIQRVRFTLLVASMRVIEGI